HLLRSMVKVEASVVCYAVALLLPLALLGGSAAITVLTGATRPTPAQLAKWPQIMGNFIFMLLFVGVGEEPGWRGFAIPQLQARFSPVVSTMVLAPIWLLWHAPLFASGEFVLNQLAPFAVTVFGGALALTWLYNRSGGSVLQPMLMHATINAVGAGYVFPMFHGVELTRMWWIYAAVWAVAGGIFVVVMRVKRTQGIAVAS
ncbi:MAG TPA: CPBP family intramembrane glutamic endopeptidase, partial [Terriglobales bacterium]|nr:CPBP family intramembrane glutamic endopeptidase [Terriglobales bacterium]